MRKFIIICAFIALQLSVSAQNIITGKVTDQNQNPLPGATIYIPEMSRGTYTNAEGVFELTNLPNGKIRLQFSFIGYNNHFESLSLTGSKYSLKVVLHQTPIESEAIVITSGYNATQHENAVKIDVFKLNLLTTISTPNFSELLTKVPGVDMISKGSGVSKPVIRGLSMNDILVLNNGVRFENYQYSSHHPLGIDEFGIENVEVIKGPASLLYGSDAIGGVINFIKEKPASAGTILGDYNLQLHSNTLGVVNNFGIKGASRKLSGGIRIGQKSHADFLQGGGKFAPNTRFNEWSFKANAGLNEKFGTFRLFFDHNNSQLGLAEDEAIEVISIRGRIPEIFYQRFTTNMLSSQNKLFLGRYRLDANMALQNTELIHFGEQSVYEIQMNLSTLTYETRLHLPSGEKSDYIIGFQGMQQKNTNLNNRETILLPDARTHNFSGFVLLQNTFFTKLKIQTGFRFDHRIVKTDAVGMPDNTEGYREPLSKMYDSFSGSAGATYSFSEQLLLRANLASAYRTPNLAELTSKGPHELRYEMGDKNLVPEKSLEADVSTHLHRENLTLDLALFINQVNDYIYIARTDETTSTGMAVYQYKQADSYLYGGEAGAHFHPRSVRWLHLETTLSSVTGKQKNGEYLPFIPAHKLNVEARAEKNRVLFLRNTFITLITSIAFKQNHPAPEESRTPGYTLTDLAIGGMIKLNNQEISMRLGANNLFDQKYTDHLSTLKEVSLLNPGRNISFSLQIPFTVKK